MKKLMLAAMFAVALWAGAQEPKRYVKGADISWVTELESRGTKFCDFDGREMECTALMQALGMDAIRLRVWVNPKRGFNNKEDVLLKAKRAAALGMDVMIDFHYSDNWADPGKQYPPEAWKDHCYKQMKRDVYDHTVEVLTYLKVNGIEPKWVQVGNETTNGLLWPTGKIDEHPKQYAGLIKAGCKGVKKVFPKAKTIVHLDNGFDHALYDYNLGVLKANKVKYDLIGMSLYPLAAVEWHPTKVRSAEDAIDKCVSNIKRLYEWLGKETIITEVGVKVSQPEEGYRLLKRTIDLSREQTDGHCLGIFYWEPEAAMGYNGGYDMGAFERDEQGRNRPTKIMRAF